MMQFSRSAFLNQINVYRNKTTYQNLKSATIGLSPLKIL